MSSNSLEPSKSPGSKKLGEQYMKLKIVERLPAVLVSAVAIGGALVVVIRFYAPSDTLFQQDVPVPPLSIVAEQGKKLFDASCAQCHGAKGVGTDVGPPLIHSIYNPGHHSDEAFLLAARQGVRQHHWKFGNMPAQPQVTDAQLIDIVRYIREMQAANGITYQPHNM
jgi:mono/diheme cytochrome c family protein